MFQFCKLNADFSCFGSNLEFQLLFLNEQKKKRKNPSRTEKPKPNKKQQDRLIKKSKIRIADEETKSERKIFC